VQTQCDENGPMCVSASAYSLRPLRSRIHLFPIITLDLPIPPKPILRNVRALDRRSSHIPDVAGHATRQAADDASLVVRALPSSSLTRRAHKCRSRTPRAVTLRRKGRSAFDGSPGQVRPYVRPVTRLWSRWPSWVCAYVSGTNLYGVLEGTETNPVLPELSLTTAFPITLLSVSHRGSSQARARRLPTLAQEPHATAAMRPFAW
jgi:hypothetical protein